MSKKKNPAAVALGKLGGRKGGRARMQTLSPEQREALARQGGAVGGPARAAKLTPQQRIEIAKKAAASRWKKKRSENEGEQ